MYWKVEPRSKESDDISSSKDGEGREVDWIKSDDM